MHLAQRLQGDAALAATARSGAALGEPVLDEGGQSDLAGRAAARANPVRRRYLKVADASAVGEVEEASYQTLMVVCDVPDGGMVFPGSEVVGRVDESGVPVDWAMRLSVRSSAAVASRNQRALRNLNEQYGQREGEVGLDALDAPRAADHAHPGLAKLPHGGRAEAARGARDDGRLAGELHRRSLLARGS